MLRSALFFVLLVGAAWARSRPLQIYFIDVEGGQATLLLSPSGQSMLIDTGWPGFNGRDADRIVTVATGLGLHRIDYVVITHYHRDHVGGIAQLAERIRIGTLVDHGPNLEKSEDARQDYAAYEKVVAKTQHLVVKAGDVIPISGIKVDVVSSAGKDIKTPLPGAGLPNPLCAEAGHPKDDPTENARSVGLLISYEKFRFLDLGDLTQQKELHLVCPKNLIGTVDVFLVTHHGMDISNAKPLVWAVHPRVAIMNNGEHKGGSPRAWEIVHSSPGLVDLWQLHYAADAGQDHNVPEQFIANVDARSDGHYISVMGNPDGTFSVTNTRNGFRKDY
jgi:beta-lactamase superfamily II metal-dependent hydrolase